MSHLFKNSMKIIPIILMLISFSALADIKERQIDLSDCLHKDCFSRGVHEFKPEVNIKIQAWFDIIRWEGKRGTKFYPLFNVYNFTGKASEILIGMQLLDKNKKMIAEAKFRKSFKPVNSNEPSNETYISINAVSLTDKVIEDTKYFNN